MAINYFAENITKPKLRYRLISKWIKTIIFYHHKKCGNLTYIFCDDNYILAINKKYLNHDYYTDIITFDYANGLTISGDIFISCEMVSENSVKFGVNLEDEFLRVIAHGILHLLGYKDGSEEEKEVMRKKETEFLGLYKEIENGIIEL